MNNVWIVVPIISNNVDLSGFVEKFAGGYTAPEFYESEVFNQETREIEKKSIPHPHFGKSGLDFSNKIIFVNTKPSYTEYNNVVHLEDFDDISIYRAWNLGIDHAVSNGAEYVVLLNGVIDFDPFVIFDSYNAIIEQEKELVNIFDGAVMILSASSSLRPDNQFQIWFGDNDLYRRSESVLGYSRSDYFRLDYLIEHNNDETFNSIVKSDESKYNAKWS
jgi:hypothetical protein